MSEIFFFFFLGGGGGGWAYFREGLFSEGLMNFTVAFTAWENTVYKFGK